MRRGYTLVEVMMAMGLLMILTTPLAWMTIQTANGKARARRIDDATCLVREDWGLVRLTAPKLLRDTSYPRRIGDHEYLLVRRVFDTVPDPATAAPVIGQVGAIPAPTVGPSVRACVLDPADDPDDSVRCFGWRVPLTEIQR
jgi:hypothetical protein